MMKKCLANSQKMKPECTTISAWNMNLKGEKRLVKAGEITPHVQRIMIQSLKNRKKHMLSIWEMELEL